MKMYIYLKKKNFKTLSRWRRLDADLGGANYSPSQTLAALHKYQALQLSETFSKYPAIICSLHTAPESPRAGTERRGVNNISIYLYNSKHAPSHL